MGIRAWYPVPLARVSAEDILVIEVIIDELGGVGDSCGLWVSREQMQNTEDPQAGRDPFRGIHQYEGFMNWTSISSSFMNQIS
jgi:hypothetical protein